MVKGGTLCDPLQSLTIKYITRKSAKTSMRHKYGDQFNQMRSFSFLFVISSHLGTGYLLE